MQRVPGWLSPLLLIEHHILKKKLQRLGFECQYLRLVPQKRASLASTGSLSALPTPLSLQQTDVLPIQNESVQKDSVQSSSIPLPAWKSDFFEDIFMTDARNDTTPWAAADYSVSLNGNQDLVLPAQPDPFSHLEEDMQVGINEDFDAGILSPTQSFPFLVRNDAQNSTAHLDSPSLELVLAANVQDDTTGFGINGINRIEQHDLVKDALLRDIQEHCNRQHGSQSEELVRAFRRLLSSDHVSIYPKSSGTDDGEEPPLTRAFVFDCIEGRSNPADKDQIADGSIFPSSIREGSAR